MEHLGVVKPIGRRRWADRAFVAVCIASASASVLILLVLLGSIVQKGLGRLSWAFLNNFPSRNAAEAGFKGALWGSVWLCAVCVLMAIPIGVATAVLLEEYAPRRRLAQRFHFFVQLNIRNLAGVPSIVYGIIGLTVFVRMFGALGNPNQYDQLVRARLTDGSVVEGLLVSDEPDSLVIDVTGVQGAERVPEMEWPTGVVVNLGLISGDASKFVNAEIGGPVALPLARDFNLPLEIGFALVPVEEVPPLPMITVEGVVRAVNRGALQLDQPAQGVVAIDGARIVSRERIAVRGHMLTLKSGGALRGDTMSTTAEGRLRLNSGARGAVEIDHSQVASYRPLLPLSLGDPESILYLRLPLGGSVLAGGLTLMLVVLPVVIISSQEALRAVPRSLREGAFAAGATRWQVVWRMVLPSATPGILTGSILAMSRAIGEAAPLLVVGGFLFITFTPSNLMSDFAAMPLQIYQWASRPQPEFYEVAAAGIIVLVAVLLAFNAAAILLRQRHQPRSR